MVWKKLHQDFLWFWELRKSSWMIWVFILGVYMVLHGFTWMIYELCLFLQSIGMVQSVPLVGKLWRGFAFVSYLKQQREKESRLRCTAYPRRNQLTMLVIPLDSWGVFFMYLKTEMVARFAASLLGVFLANAGCIGFMCWIICKHKWAKCKRNEFGLCIWVWIVGYDALPWKIRDLNTVLGLKLSKSVFQNANRHALDPFSSDS